MSEPKLASNSSALAEKDVGITQFAGNHEGFFAIIKQRYSDFMVNELSATGEELHLTDIVTMPQLPVPTVPAEDAQTVEEDEQVDLQLPNGVTEEMCKQMEAISAKPIGDDTVPGTVCICATSLSKDERKAVHRYIQLQHPILVSSTADQGEHKFIKVVKGNAATLQRDRKRRNPRVPRLFTHFLLYKENMDTMEAANRLATKLRIKTHDVGYAGTKDRRGKTVQLAAVSKISPERISDAARSIRQIHVGNFSYQLDGVVLGQLSGNTFRIVLREVKATSTAAIAAAVHEVQKRGVFNYYGMQRFGTQAGHTHTVGKLMISAAWEKAINTILLPRSNDPTDVKSNILNLWQQRKLSTNVALERLRGDYRLKGVELQLLQGIMDRGPNDYLGAINYIPRNNRTLYLYAYQAYLWNRLLSRRVDKYGLDVLPGDLVAVKQYQKSSDLDLEAETPEEEETAEAPAAQKGGKGRARLLILQNSVRTITEEEVSAIDISQVLLPGLGHSVRLPANELADWCREMLAEDGLTMESFDHNQKSYAVSGAYRAMILSPKNLSFKICRYTDPLKPLQYSDMDNILDAKREEIEEISVDDPIELPNMPPVSDSAGIETEKCDSTVKTEDVSDEPPKLGTDAAIDKNQSILNEIKEEKDDIPASEDVLEESVKIEDKHDSTVLKDGSKEHNEAEAAVPKSQVAVILQFTLPPAAYATMVLREILKMDTGSQYHASLNTNSVASTEQRDSTNWHQSKRGGDRGDSRGRFNDKRGGGFNDQGRSPHKQRRDRFNDYRGGNRGGGNRGNFRGNRGRNRGNRGHRDRRQWSQYNDKRPRSDGTQNGEAKRMKMD